MAESRTGPKFGHPTLFLFLAYFSFTSPFLLDLHDAFTTCSRGVVLRKLLVGLTGFAGPLHVPNLTLCSYFGSSVQI